MPVILEHPGCLSEHARRGLSEVWKRKHVARGLEPPMLIVLEEGMRVRAVPKGYDCTIVRGSPEALSKLIPPHEQTARVC